MTPEQHDTVKRALRRIACNHRVNANGFSTRLSNAEKVNLAREACNAMGWKYSLKDILDLGDKKLT